MPCLPALLGTPLKARVVERLLRGGPAPLTDLAKDVEASRQQIRPVVAELVMLGILREVPTSDRRVRLLAIDEGHPFVEPLRVLAIDASAWYEAPETWQTLLAQRFGEDWYVGGYQALRRVMQPIDFEAPDALANVLKARADDKGTTGLERAANIRLRIRPVDHIPPEVVPVERAGATVWFATPERGLVEAWQLHEIPLYGLFLCLVQGIHDGVLDPDVILRVADSDQVADARAALTAVRARIPMREPQTPIARPARKLNREEQSALEQALNTVVG